DRRGKMVEMTQKGRQILDAYVNRQAKRERDLLSRLGPAERLALNDLLRKLVASITAEQPK
ncbi:MAG TPA: hypothetical protein VGS21_07265, partial [Acidimicrobiales bacterium]|nr:hypothetical protein [Acidimicrobiales bacterium]